MAYQKLGFKNGNVLTAEQLIHMEDGIIAAEKKAQEGGNTGTGLPSGGEPYMQLVTDGEGKAGWEQRLAWKEESIVELFPEQTLEFSGDGDVFTCEMETNVTLIKGGTYTVTWDSVEYECVAKEDPDGNLYIGNVAVWGYQPDTGEPFVFYPDSEWEDYFNTLSTEQNHTVSIFGPGVVSHGISSEYMPSPFEKLLTEDEYETIAKWDGNTSGLDQFSFNGYLYCKVDEVPLTYEDFASQKYKTVVGGEADEDFLSEYDLWMDEAKTCINAGLIMSSAVEGNCVLIMPNGNTLKVNIPSKGLYFARINATRHVNGLYKATGAKCITGVVFGGGVLKHDKYLLTIKDGNINVTNLDGEGIVT